MKIVNGISWCLVCSLVLGPMIAMAQDPSVGKSFDLRLRQAEEALLLADIRVQSNNVSRDAVRKEKAIKWEYVIGGAVVGGLLSSAINYVGQGLAGLGNNGREQELIEKQYPIWVIGGILLGGGIGWFISESTQ